MAGLRESGRWRVLAGDVAAEHAVRAATGITSLAARVLVARGVRDADAARAFLTPSLDRDWLDPLELPGLAAAADRVERAISDHEVIAVFGDFDVDGMSSTCLLTLALRELGAEVHPYIPRRFGEGYGLSAEALQRVVDGCDPDLIVTVDNGIAAAAEVEMVRAKGIDVVVTDHHEPADLVPEGVPVCDPKLDHACPSCDLAGAGVALKLAHELGRRLGKPGLWRSYTDVATLGTISDMMNLTRENRALVAEGIARMRHTDRPGIVALAAVAGTDLSRIEADMLPFSLVPRLNAAGRMGDVDVAFDLLISNDADEAARLAAELETINQNRRDIERELAEQAFAMIEETYDGGRAIVVGGEGWHEGVKGIVASRVVNRFHVPAILFSISDGVAHGSGRSVGSVNLFDAVERCADLLVRFGGHAGAVGVTIDADRIDEFRARLESVLAELPAEQFVDTGEVAAEVGLSELDVPTIESLQVLAPFGQGNKVPLLAVTGVLMRNRGRVGRSGEHLRFLATDGVSSVPAIMFRTPDVERACDYEGAVDLVFEAVAETWQGRTKAKLMVRDIIYRTADVGAPAPEVADEIFSRVPKILAADSREASLAADASARSPLSSLDEVALTRELVRRFIGDNDLLPAQRAALDALAAGKNALCVMATGRGKSLVFHVHAAREALLAHKASVLVFPLRALVADQSFHIAGELSSLGLSARVLTGETSAEGRAETFSGLGAGTVDVILTTPEFLAIHSGEFAASGRVGFVVIDEAHHAGTSAGGTRSAYQDLPRVLSELGRPRCLAVTATAAAPAATEICRLAGIDGGDVIVDDTCRANLELDDEREMRDRDAALVALASTGEKCVCYVNSREQSVVLARTLRRENPELGQRIAFYNAGLTRSERLRVEAAFRSGQLTCVISTSAFGEGVNIPDIRHVVLYHMPFGAIEFNQMSGRAGRDGRPATIHLMFGSRDARVNERILASYAPDRASLVCLWRALRGLTQRAEATGEPGVTRTNAELVEACLQVSPTVPLDERSVSAGIAIFRELGLVGVDGFGSKRCISMARAPEHMELDSSIRYLEGMKSSEEFHEFSGWVLSATPTELLDRINRPITPGFGTLVDGGRGRSEAGARVGEREGGSNG